MTGADESARSGQSMRGWFSCMGPLEQKKSVTCLLNQYMSEESDNAGV